MTPQTSSYGVRITIPAKFPDAVAKVRAALGGEGFGVLCQIDVAATMKEKLNVDFKPYVILGACNPRLAFQALSGEPDIGLLLPCNVIVYADDREGRSVVAVIDPVEALGITGNESLRPIAQEVRTRLVRVLEAVAGSDASPA